MGIWDWVKTAASNDVADPAINYRERQAPSTLNNAGRALMAALASFRDDMAGAIETAGSSSAYTVASFSGLVDGNTDYLNNVCIAFVPHITNAPNPTLNVDSGGALPLRGATGVDLPAGVLIEGTPYVALLNPGKTEWLLHGYRNEPTTVPIGVPLPFWGSVAPNSQFVFCYGQAISRTTYAALWALAGSPDTGDGNTTFNILDLRGRSIFGKDDMGGVAANRLTSAGSGVDGATLGAVGGAQSVLLVRSDLPNVAPTFTGTPGVASSTVQFVDNLSGTTREAGASGGIASSVPFKSTVSSNFTPAGTVQSLNGGVSQTNVNKMPPAIVLPYIMRVL